MRLEELADFKKISLSELDENFSIFSCTKGVFSENDIFGEDSMELEGVYYFKGDVHITEDVINDGSYNYTYYIIDGDVTIDGTLSLHVYDFYNVLGITGTLKAKNLCLNSNAFLYVKKEVNIQNVIYSSLSDSGCCTLHSKATSKTLIRDPSTDVGINFKGGYIGEVVDPSDIMEGFDDMDYTEVVEYIMKT